MTQIKSWALTGDVDAFRQGVAAYRNGRDWAKCQRDDAINQANEKQAKTKAGASLVDDGLELSFSSRASAAGTIIPSQQTTTYHGSPVPLSIESETSADEPSLDYAPPYERTKSRSPRRRQLDI
ncbi:hypothetical protein NOR_04614 [Metarhizium rileyi]|uniref:Uncharacterized protein n=1 Tax=Metarhizium rileyi (strain RCEF 4871) TaxID=1649241 RepID=A0A167E3N5_METRR|nr:hypothetical protein NOR_04614 [Metarhizium rileyi RCEF 4871]TWU76893.1 hypothetical protein ED733_006675 [Metarhizium rileyi]